MKYINMAVALRDHPDMLRASLEQVGAWMFLQCYCHDQENYGKIDDCKTWPDKMWIRLGLPSAAIILADSPLWHWQGLTLIVHHYNKAEQEKHDKMIKQRRQAIAARWAKERAKSKPGNNGNHTV